MEGEDGKVESGDLWVPPMILPPKAQLSSSQQETLGFHVDLARVAPNGEREQPQAPCLLDTSEPNTAHDTLDSHALPSTPHLPHPVKPEGNQCSSSPTWPHGVGEGRVPLWIKWRGKWQAGLQCSLEDCPVQTIKAMPTYGRKSYIVVFFPNSKSFVWTDWQLVCPIFEDPEPLAFGTHEGGRDLVSDLNGARQFMLRKISSALLDISDRLPVQAVVNCARDVTFWKDFAKDAAKAVSYEELGGLLVTLKSMILPKFIKESWLQNCIEDWKRQCETVETAASMEKLAKELKSAVVWDEVGKLWDQLEQTNLDSEWTTWKENANCNDLNAPNNSFTGQRRPYNPPHGIPEGSHGQGLPVYAGIEDSEQQDSKRIKMEDKSSLSELMAGSLMQRGIGKNTYILSLSAVTNSTLSWGSKLNEGAVGEPADDQKKGKLPVVDNPGDNSSGVICIGTTKFGKRCTHKARDGSIFCLKHTSKLVNGENFASTPFAAASSGSMELQPHVAEQNVNRKRKLGTTSTGKASLTSLKASKLASKVAAQFANGTRCIGWCGNGTQCSHRAKLGFSHCEKHLPTSMKGHQERVRASNATQSTQSNENSVCLTQLKELVNEYVRSRLGEDGAQSSQHSKTWQKIIDAIRLEVDSKLNLAESLCKIISSEMESLKKHFEQEVTEAQKTSSSLLPRPIEQGSCSMPSAGGELAFEHLSNVELLKQVSMKCTASIPRYRCKLCAQEFVELNVLGQHWRACHKKEAQQYFRGFTCQHCNLPFTNKKGLYRHRNNHHPGMSSQTKSSPLALCNICSGQFMGFEDLWQHVICSHPDQMCAYWPATTDMNSPLTHWKPSGLEVFDFGKCSDCNNKFSTYAELQQHRESAHKSYDLSSHMESLRTIPGTKDELKYKCKVCGLRFRLLPDLGRHHQAEHKPAQVMRLKNVKKDSLSSSPLEEGNSVMGGEKAKKKLQKLDIRRAPVGNFRAETPMVAQQHAVSFDQSISDIEGYVGPKLEGFPSSSDILAVARSACCKNKLYSVLLKKYVSLPDRLALKAAKLCSEANVRLEFYRDGYVCPYSCKEVSLSSSDSKPLTDSSFSFGNGLSLLPQFGQPFSENKCLLKNTDIVLDESHVVLTASPGVKESINDKMVLCDDLSFGKERVPIPCVVDRDVLGPCSCAMCVDNQNSQPEALMPWLDFSYVTKRTLDPSLGLDTESSGLGCGCQGLQCSPAQCEHVYIFDNDNTDAQDIYGQPMVGRFPYDSQGCIILEEGYLVYECNSICSCHESCHNRVLQKGVQVKLEVYKTRHKGWAVRAAQRIARGTFVCEYIGEVLDDCEANKRGERYDKEGCSYLYDIDAHIDIGRRGRPKPFVIDATKYGNVARFINHSCSPNLVNYQVLVESMDCQLAHIGLYSTRDINIGEELAYDYRYKLLPGKGCPCHCGASECRGRLY